MRFGIEEEYCLISLPDGLLNNSINEVLENIPLVLRDGHIKPDLHKCILETSTCICDSYQQMCDEISRLRRTALQAVQDEGLGIISCGTHPISPWQEAILIDTPRYQRLIAGGALLAEGVHFGMHIHYEVPDDELRVKLINAVRLLIPEVVAVSVNSPFCDGVFSGYKSTRLHRYDPTPTVGIPPSLKNWSDYATYLKSVERLGIREEKDIYWDVRHRHNMGTLEFRVMDTQASVTDSIAIISFVVSLLMWTEKFNKRGNSLPIAVATEKEARSNREQAKIHGLEATFTISEKEVSARERLLELLTSLQNPGFAEGLRLTEKLVAAGLTGADRQLSKGMPEKAIAWLQDIFLD
jgi:carboxylate-amine ligase